MGVKLHGKVGAKAVAVKKVSGVQRTSRSPAHAATDFSAHLELQETQSSSHGITRMDTVQKKPSTDYADFTDCGTEQKGSRRKGGKPQPALNQDG